MNLSIAFFLSAIVMVFKMHYGLFLHPFIPFLVLVANKPFIIFLWLGLLCGLCVDLFSSYPFGVITLMYTGTVFLLSFFKKSFSEKKISIFFINTLFASIAFSVLSLALLSGLQKESSFNLSSLIVELLVYCPFDALMGTVIIYFPLWAFEKSKKIPFKRGFFKKRRS